MIVPECSTTWFIAEVLDGGNCLEKVGCCFPLPKRHTLFQGWRFPRLFWRRFCAECRTPFHLAFRVWSLPPLGLVFLDDVIVVLVLTIALQFTDELFRSLLASLFVHGNTGWVSFHGSLVWYHPAGFCSSCSLNSSNAVNWLFSGLSSRPRTSRAYNRSHSVVDDCVNSI